MLSRGACRLWLIILGYQVLCSGAVDSTTETQLAPAGKWVQCIEDGRLNIKWTVSSLGKLYSGLQLTNNVQRCEANKPSSCKWLASCDATESCTRFFPGELSGRQKCLVLLNPSSSDSSKATITLSLESAGNWSAIIFGVVLTSLGLLAVVSAGCYSDLKKLAAGDKQRRKAAASNRPAIKAAAGTDWRLQAVPLGNSYAPNGLAPSSAHRHTP